MKQPKNRIAGGFSVLLLDRKRDKNNRLDLIDLMIVELCMYSMRIQTCSFCMGRGLEVLY